MQRYQTHIRVYVNHVDGVCEMLYAFHDKVVVNQLACEVAFDDCFCEET